ncbi:MULTISPECIES: hypothetical protein [Christiangramia]|uniref:hypothetical protein n=1 Tax=Christiangramia TaxID=292691 RepID=UPI0009F8EEC5|nr:hypothetical protein [Christiangramia flava]
MKTILILGTILSFSIFQNLYCQQNFDARMLQATVLANQSNPTLSSGIYINQIGNQNDVQIDVSLKKNDRLEVQQIGDLNEVVKIKRVNYLDEKVVQIGHQNRIYDMTNSPSIDSRSQLIQRGNYLQIYKVGSNSISENLKISMTGNYRSIAIHNF